MTNSKFKIASSYKPSGDQPFAIKKLCKGLEDKLNEAIVLLNQELTLKTPSS